MTRPLLGRSVAEAGNEANPEDQVVGRVSTNLQPSVIIGLTLARNSISFTVSASVLCSLQSSPV